MASTGKRTTVKEPGRTARPSDPRKISARKLALVSSARSTSEIKAYRPPKSVHVTEDEADILISIRRENEKRVSLAEVLRKHGHGLEG
jgi:hypothetical protein